MNNKGFLNFIPFLRGASLIWKILIVVLIIILLIPVIVYFFPIAKWIILIVIGFVIMGWVSQAFGNNILTYLVVGILMYFVFKYFNIAAGAFLIYFFLVYGFMSVIIWGTARFGK